MPPLHSTSSKVTVRSLDVGAPRPCSDLLTRHGRGVRPAGRQLDRRGGVAIPWRGASIHYRMVTPCQRLRRQPAGAYKGGRQRVLPTDGADAQGGTLTDAEPLTNLHAHLRQKPCGACGVPFEDGLQPAEIILALLGATVGRSTTAAWSAAHGWWVAGSLHRLEKARTLRAHGALHRGAHLGIGYRLGLPRAATCCPPSLGRCTRT